MWNYLMWNVECGMVAASRNEELVNVKCGMWNGV